MNGKKIALLGFLVGMLVCVANVLFQFLSLILGGIHLPSLFSTLLTLASLAAYALIALGFVMMGFSGSFVDLALGGVFGFLALEKVLSAVFGIHLGESRSMAITWLCLLMYVLPFFLVALRTLRHQKLLAVLTGGFGLFYFLWLSVGANFLFRLFAARTVAAFVWNLLSGGIGFVGMALCFLCLKNADE